jgi:hypothetical protein
MAFFPTANAPQAPTIRPKYILFRTDEFSAAANLKAFKMDINTGAVTVGASTAQPGGDDFGAAFGMPGAKATKYDTQFKPPWSSNYAVIPWPSKASRIEYSSSLVTQAAGGVYVEDNPNGGFVSGDWMISGRIGPLPYKPKQYNVMASLPPDNWKDIDGGGTMPLPFLVLKEAIELTNQDKPGSRLVLYSLQEGEYWYVQPLTRAIMRDPSFRTGCTYEFQFKLLERADPPTLNLIATKATDSDTLSWYDKTLNGLNTGIKAVNAAISVVAYVETRVGQYVNQFKSAMNNVAATFDNGLATVETIVNTPEKLHIWGKGYVNTLISDWNSVLTATEDMVQFFGGSDADSSADELYDDDPAVTPEARIRLGVSLTDIKALQDNADAVSAAISEIIVGLRMGLGAAIDRMEYREIQPGDTLEAIALAVYGNPAAATKIAQWNNLRPPYISAAGYPGTLRAGMRIAIPKEGSGAVGVLATFEPMTTDERYYGRGIKLVTDGSWTGDFEKAPDNVGLVDVAGNDCVNQGLRVRMSTQFGTDAVFPLMGIPDAVGQITDDTSRLVFNIATGWQLRADNRVDAVTKLDITDTGEDLKVNADVRLKTTANKIQVTQL